MTASRLITALAVAAVLMALAGLAPALAFTEIEPGVESAYAAQEAENGEGADVATIVWTLVGIGIAALVLSALYLLKRQVGGFPENPTWVAPITIMPARENPTEETYGETPAHENHSPAH